jgi:hypothetical protein
LASTLSQDLDRERSYGETKGELEIVKFHGDFEDDATLVLTESSYFERLDFESPIDQMLRADVLRHPVLFVGYSLSDINVRYLFHKLSKIWSAAGTQTERPPSHIFMTNPNPVEEAIFRRWESIRSSNQAAFPWKAYETFSRGLLQIT